MNTIEIRTTQNVSIQYELASLQERIIANIIDWMITGLVAAILIGLLVSAINDINALGGVVSSLLPIGLFIVYQLCFEIFANGQSIGKKAMRIKVVRIDGREPSLSDYLLRAVFHIIDSILSLGALASIFIISSPKNQRLGDMTANTTVIRLRSNLQFSLENILKIDSKVDYKPLYPQVRQLSEQDMLLVKQTLLRFKKHPNDAHREAVVLLTQRLCSLLHISESDVTNKQEFLKTLLHDYIVLTR